MCNRFRAYRKAQIYGMFSFHCLFLIIPVRHYMSPFGSLTSRHLKKQGNHILLPTQNFGVNPESSTQKERSLKKKSGITSLQTRSDLLSGLESAGMEK